MQLIRGGKMDEILRLENLFANQKATGDYAGALETANLLNDLRSERKFKIIGRSAMDNIEIGPFDDLESARAYAREQGWSETLIKPIKWGRAR
jgi:hypothetical protein